MIMKSRLLGKLIFAAIIVLTFLVIVQQPAQAAESTSGFFGWLSGVADSFGEFLGLL